MSVDVEIYMNNIVKFFKENPKDLINLVPKNKEEEFYKKIRETAIQNYNKGEDISLTQSQMIDVCVRINREFIHKIDNTLSHIFVKTKFGIICLN